MAGPDDKDTQSGEPEPVDAEFEPVDREDDAKAKREKRGGPGWFALVVLVLLTALIAAAVTWALTRYAVPRLEEQSVGALEARIAELEARDPAAGAVSAETVEALEARVEALSGLEPQVEELAASVSGLEDRIEVLGRRAASSQSDDGDTQPGGGIDPDALDALREQVAGLAERTENALAAASTAQDDVEDLRGQVSQDSAPAANLQAVEDIQDRLAALETRVGELRDSLASEDERLGERVDTVREGLSGLESDLSALDARIEEATELARSAQTGPGSDNDALRTLSARALGLAALSDAASRAQPFEAERAALARVWPGNRDLSALESVARSGAPTRTGLAERFPAEAIRDAAGTRRTLFGLIEVQGPEASAGEGEESPRELVNRAESRLARDDLSGAADAVSSLQGAPGEAAADWLRGARARLEIETRLDALRTQLSEAAAENEARP
ncbi:COG4223 family protein [Marinicauda sp. Alg238-R41]|uniref:COG4223 family protein n=1 Tax=Marinicauda sp. Alg238-R41 TaxID=2993447 RepID=UPI0022E07D5A|nr:mitofilin family membrane protein [Marinicauda sp. Alg238-R41]